MAKQRESVRFRLTPEQQEQVKGATGKDAEVLELTVEELEERITPGGEQELLIRHIGRPRVAGGS